MELHIRLQGRKGLADQLYQQLRASIDSGHLAAGTQLPPLACSPNNWACPARPSPKPTRA